MVRSRNELKCVRDLQFTGRWPLRVLALISTGDAASLPNQPAKEPRSMTRCPCDLILPGWPWNTLGEGCIRAFSLIEVTSSHPAQGESSLMDKQSNILLTSLPLALSPTLR